jgi:DNA-binding cell septation regulator SpoVG
MIEILKYKVVNKGTIAGILNVKIPKWGNFIINEIILFKKDNNMWLSFPSRKYEKEGSLRYFPFMRFEHDDMRKAFQNSVLEALEQHLKLYPPQQETEVGKIPF